MLRYFFRSIVLNAFCIYLSTLVIAGLFYFQGGWGTIILAGLIISLSNLFVKPIVNLLLLPIHLLTLGLSRWISNLVSLYLVTWLLPGLQIHDYTFPGLNLSFIIIPPLHFSAFGAYLLATLVLTFCFHILYWLFQE